MNKLITKVGYLELEEKDFVCVVGKPACGKSTFIMNSICSASKEHKTLFFSIEGNKLKERYPNAVFDNIEIVDYVQEIEEIEQYISKFSGSWVYIDYLNLISINDTPNNDMKRIVEHLHNCIEKYNVRILAVNTISSKSTLDDVKRIYLNGDYDKTTSIYAILDDDTIATIK